MPQRRWSKRRVVISGFVVIPRFSRFEVAGDATWSMSVLACAIRIIRTSTEDLGKVVSNAAISGRHAITKSMRKTRSIGQDIERRWEGNEVQIPGTKNALYRTFLDSLSYSHIHQFGRQCQLQNLLGGEVMSLHSLPDTLQKTKNG
jgi:hypothetical protein